MQPYRSDVGSLVNDIGPNFIQPGTAKSTQ